MRACIYTSLKCIEVMQNKKKKTKNVSKLKRHEINFFLNKKVFNLENLVLLPFQLNGITEIRNIYCVTNVQRHNSCNCTSIYMYADINVST